MRQAFGAQGSEGWSVLTEPQVLQQLPQLREWTTQMPGGERFFNDLYGASELQQGKDTFAEFNRSLMDVGSVALPAASDALKAFDSGLQHLNKTLEGAGVPEGAAGHIDSWALAGGAALAAIPPLRRGVWWALKKAGQAVAGGGGGDAAAGAAEGAAAAAAAGAEGAAAAAGAPAIGRFAGPAGVALGGDELLKGIEDWMWERLGFSKPTGYDTMGVGPALVPVPYWDASKDTSAGDVLSKWFVGSPADAATGAPAPTATSPSAASSAAPQIDLDALFRAMRDAIAAGMRGVEVNLNIDGRQLGHALFDPDAATTGPSGFDGKLSPPYPGAPPY
jgi:hypothetical protein